MEISRIVSLNSTSSIFTQEHRQGIHVEPEQPLHGVQEKMTQLFKEVLPKAHIITDLTYNLNNRAIIFFVKKPVFYNKYKGSQITIDLNNSTCTRTRDGVVLELKYSFNSLLDTAERAFFLLKRLTDIKSSKLFSPICHSSQSIAEQSSPSPELLILSPNNNRGCIELSYNDKQVQLFIAKVIRQPLKVTDILLNYAKQFKSIESRLSFLSSVQSECFNKQLMSVNFETIKNYRVFFSDFPYICERSVIREEAMDGVNTFPSGRDVARRIVISPDQGSFTLSNMSAEYEVFDIESEKRQVGMGSNKRVRDASQALDGNSFVTVKTNIENLKDAIEFFHEVQVLKSIHPQLSTSWPVFLAKDGSKP